MHECDRFLSLSRAAESLGVDRRRIREAIRCGELPSFDDPLNRRHTLVAAEDLARLRQPRPRANSPLSAAV